MLLALAATGMNYIQQNANIIPRFADDVSCILQMGRAEKGGRGFRRLETLKVFCPAGAALRHSAPLHIFEYVKYRVAVGTGGRGFRRLETLKVFGPAGDVTLNRVVLL